jgi:hypothetical protein
VQRSLYDIVSVHCSCPLVFLGHWFAQILFCFQPSPWSFVPWGLGTNQKDLKPILHRRTICGVLRIWFCMRNHTLHLNQSSRGVPMLYHLAVDDDLAGLACACVCVWVVVWNSTILHNSVFIELMLIPREQHIFKELFTEDAKEPPMMNHNFCTTNPSSEQGAPWPRQWKPSPRRCTSTAEWPTPTTCMLAQWPQSAIGRHPQKTIPHHILLSVPPPTPRIHCVHQEEEHTEGTSASRSGRGQEQARPFRAYNMWVRVFMECGWASD